MVPWYQHAREPFGLHRSAHTTILLGKRMHARRCDNSLYCTPKKEEGEETYVYCALQNDIIAQ